MLYIAPLFVIPASYAIDPKVSKDLFFIFAVLLSSICFGIKKDANPFRIALVVLSLVIFDVFFSVGHIYQNLCFLCGFMLLAISKDIKAKRILPFIQAACLTQAVIVVSQKVGVDVYSEIIFFLFDANKSKVIQEVYPVVGSLMNPNYAALFIVITLPSLFTKKTAFILPLPLIALSFCGSITAVFAILASLVVLIHHKTKHGLKVFIAFAVSTLSALVYSIKFDGVFNDHLRYEVWGNTFKLVNNFILGHGLGFFHDNYSKTFISYKVWQQAHNEYLEIYVAFGVVGVLIVGALLNVVIQRIIKQKDNTIFAMIVTSALFCSVTSFPFHISSCAIVAIISLGILNQGRLDGQTMDSSKHNRPSR